MEEIFTVLTKDALRSHRVGNRFFYLESSHEPLAITRLLSNKEISTRLRHQYLCTKFTEDSAEYNSFLALYPKASAGSYSVVRHGTWIGKCDRESTALDLLQILRPQTLQLQKEEQFRLQTVRRLISADRKEKPCPISAAGSASPTSPRSEPDRTKSVISVRLLQGEVVKKEFSSDQTLTDVKRWLAREYDVDMLADEDSELVECGAPREPKLKFYSPGLRVTYSPSQELLRLRDVGLWPRLALILKPELDEDLNKAQKGNRPWKVVTSAALAVFYAVNSFFDYGLDEAMTNMSMHSDDELEASYEREREILVPNVDGMDLNGSHAAPARLVSPVASEVKFLKSE